MSARPPRDFHRWVILTLKIDDGELWLTYRDEVGTRRRLNDVGGRWATKTANRSLRAPRATFTSIGLPADLSELLTDSFSDLTSTRGHWMPGQGTSLQVPWLLPVFIKPPPGHAALPWESWLEPLLLDTPKLAERCVLIRLGGRVGAPQSPISLPMLVGSSSDATAAHLEPIRERSWYARADMQMHGLRLVSPAETSTEHLTPHVLLEDARDLATHRGMDGTGARLSVVFDPTLDCAAAWLAAAGSARPGSVLILGGRSTPEPLLAMELVYALVHDFALHEIAWILRRADPSTLLWLRSSPAGVQALRLSSAVRRVTDEVMSRSAPPDDDDGALRWLAERRREARHFAADFTRESRGLTQVAELQDRLALGPHSEKVFGLSPRRGSPAPSESPEAERRVDVVVERYNEFGHLEPLAFWERHEPLRPGWRFRLNVHVGYPDEHFSAIVGPVPAVDSMLPPIADDGFHELDVVVYPKRFSLLSAALQRIRLPRRGASPPVFFELRAPTQLDWADLRIAVYLGNNLLQSFVFEARIGIAATPEPGLRPPLVQVRLASSGVAGFDNFDAYGERALSVALNDDYGHGMHTLMIKGDDETHSLALTQQQVEQQMKRFRTLLQRTTKAAAPEFDGTVRQLAQIGSKLWYEVSRSFKQDTSALRALHNGEVRTIQFVRHGSLLPVPWQAIYDYAIPEGDAFTSARVCLADGPVIRPYRTGDTGCRHCGDANVICIEGFWSVRHRIEQLTEDLATDAVAADVVKAQPGSATPAGVVQGTRSARSDTIVVPAGNPLAAFGLGLSSGATNDVLARLRERLGKDLHEWKAEDAPVEAKLWEPARRPAVLVLLSHMEPARDEQNLPPRLRAYDSADAGARISAPGLLRRKVLQDGWGADPLPLVLLLACGTAVTELGELSNLVDAFFGLGAKAVAGTECDVRASQAGEFAEQVLTGLLIGKEKLGEIVRVYHRDALQRGDAFPFVFTVYGNAGLKICREGA